MGPQPLPAASTTRVSPEEVATRIAASQAIANNPQSSPRMAPHENLSESLGPAGPLERTVGRLAPAGGIFGLVDMLTGLARGGHFPSVDASKRANLDKLQETLDEQDRAEVAARRVRQQEVRDAAEVTSRAQRIAALDSKIAISTARINILSGLEDSTENATEKAALGKAVKNWTGVRDQLVGLNNLAAVPDPLGGGMRAGTVKAAGVPTAGDDALLDRIAAGDYPPDVLSGRLTEAKIRLLDRMALLHPEFNLTEAVTNWTSRMKFTGTINNRQFTLLRSAQDSLHKLLQPVRDANEAVRKNSGLSFSPALNKWVLSPLARQGIVGRKGQKALAQRASAATQAIEPLAQIFIAGGQPTEESFALAKAVLSVDESTPPDVLDDQLDAVAPGMKVRDVAFRSQEPQAPGPAQPSRPNVKAGAGTDLPPGAVPVRPR